MEDAAHEGKESAHSIAAQRFSNVTNLWLQDDDSSNSTQGRVAF